MKRVLISLLLIHSIANAAQLSLNTAPKCPTPPLPLKIETSDWHIQKETWGTGKETQSLDTQFKADAIIFYNTLFSDAADSTRNTCKTKKVFDKNKSLCLEPQRQDFLIRLFLTLADAPLQFTAAENDQNQLQSWPYPLATSLAHGQRISFDIHGVGNPEVFYNLLLSGNRTTKPQIDMTRLGATHGFSFQKNPRVLKEIKLGPKAILKNAKIGLQGNHRGVNITLGGLGNPDKDGLIIAPEGFRYSEKARGKISSKIQHGHVYLQVASFGKIDSALMLGIEGSMPCRNCTNMYGDAHSAGSGFKSSADLTSITGGQKMIPLLKDRGCPASAQYGGLWLKFKDAEANFKHLEALFSAFFALPKQKQQILMKDLLTQNAEGARKALVQHFPDVYPNENQIHESKTKKDTALQGKFSGIYGELEKKIKEGLSKKTASPLEPNQNIRK